MCIRDRYRGKGLTDPNEVIVIHQAEEGVAKHIFSDPGTIKNIEAGGHIYRTTKFTSWLSDWMNTRYIKDYFLRDGRKLNQFGHKNYSQ